MSSFNPTSTDFYTHMLGAIPSVHPSPSLTVSRRNLLDFFSFDDKAMTTVVPPVTVVLEGRSICPRIHLQKLAGYRGLAGALRQMFVDVDGDSEILPKTDLDLSNAIPGHLIAYEDMEDDLLLAGDLHWKDFVRVAKRIRIIPVKANHSKAFQGH